MFASLSNIPTVLLPYVYRALGGVDGVTRFVVGPPPTRTPEALPSPNPFDAAALSRAQGPGLLSRLGPLFGATYSLWDQSGLYARVELARYLGLKRHPAWPALLAVVTARTAMKGDYPQIEPAALRVFNQQVKMLYSDACHLLAWLDRLENILSSEARLPEITCESLQRASKLLRRMTLTANITAPAVLWLVGKVLTTHKKLGILTDLNVGHVIKVENYARERGLNPRQLEIDLELLCACAYVVKTPLGYQRSPTAAGLVLQGFEDLNLDYSADLQGELVQWFSGQRGPVRGNLLKRWLSNRVHAAPTRTPGWIPDLRDLDRSARVVPLVLAFAAMGKAVSFQAGEKPTMPNGFPLPELDLFLRDVGLVAGDRVTDLGARVVSRGPGPFGIIAAYEPYLTAHADLLCAPGERPHVRRAANITATRAANAADFARANDALDRFCAEHDFTIRVFIEHALGLGQGTADRWQRNHAARITYIGADYEAAALAGAERRRAAGELPHNLQLLEPVDIGDPLGLFHQLRAKGIPTRGAVMMVSAGFHEIRGKSDAAMVEIFRQYQEAGIILIFIESSDLPGDLLSASAWESYYAGFRWVHDTSGQVLRPPWPVPGQRRTSWEELLQRAGYRVDPRYSHGTRTLFPTPVPERDNPPLEHTFFALPENFLPA